MHTRYIKSDFFKDEDLADLKPITRIIYAGLWCMADKEGRLDDRPERIKADIMPYDKVDMNEELSILANKKRNSGQPFIIRYLSDNQRYIQILKWREHQKPHKHEADSHIPPIPPDFDSNSNIDFNSNAERGQVFVDKPLANGQLTDRKQKHLEFVYLTEKQYNSLVEQFGSDGASAWIGKVNTYAHKIGERKFKSKYHSHYHVILEWYDKDVKSGKIVETKQIADTNTIRKEEERVKKLAGVK